VCILASLRLLVMNKRSGSELCCWGTPLWVSNEVAQAPPPPPRASPTSVEHFAPPEGMHWAPPAKLASTLRRPLLVVPCVLALP
jgi:hypothetical protein